MDPAQQPATTATALKRREELRKKLRSRLSTQQAMRRGVSKAEMNKTKQEVKDVVSDPRVTKPMMDAYIRAMTEFPTSKIPNPLEVLNDRSRHELEYKQYLLGLMSSVKNKEMELQEVSKILQNSYGVYITTVLGIPLNPFS